VVWNIDAESYSFGGPGRPYPEDMVGRFLVNGQGRAPWYPWVTLVRFGAIFFSILICSVIPGAIFFRSRLALSVTLLIYGTFITRSYDTINRHSI
jgi:hypothetical protein